MSAFRRAATYKHWDNVQLMTALANDDRLALAELYDRYWYQLYRTAYQKTYSHEIAEELVQDLFIDLWNKRSVLHVRQPMPYLFTALRYAVIDYIRHRVQQERYAEYEQHHVTPIDTTTEDLLGYNDLVAVIEEQLEKLPAKTGQVFRLSRYDDQAIPSIAQTLELSEKAVEYHLSKALKALRENLPAVSWALLAGLAHMVLGQD